MFGVAQATSMLLKTVAAKKALKYYKNIRKIEIRSKNMLNLYNL